MVASTVAVQETYQLFATGADGIRLPLCKCLSADRANQHREMLLRVGAFSNVEIERRPLETRPHYVPR